MYANTHKHTHTHKIVKVVCIPIYLLFCYVDGFIQNYPYGTFPTARMRGRSFVRHELVRVW